MSKAQIPKTQTDKQIKDSRNLKKIQGMIRQTHSGGGAPIISVLGATTPSVSTSVGGVATLKTAGDTMMGPIGFSTKLVSTITSNAIDIGSSTSSYSSHVILAATNGTVNTINGASFQGQILFLEGTSTRTYTIGTTGNITTLTGSSMTLSNTNVMIFIFDSTQNKWQMVTSGTSGSGVTESQNPVTWTGTHSFNGSSTSINSPTITIGDQTTDQVYIYAAISTDLNMNGNMIKWNIASAASTRKIAQSSQDLIYNVASTGYHIFQENATELAKIGNGNVIISTSASLNGPVTSITSPTIFLGVASTDNINSLGQMNTDLKFKATRTIDFFTTASTATAGALTLPSNPYLFILVKINGVTVKIPAYQQ